MLSPSFGNLAALAASFTYSASSATQALCSRGLGAANANRLRLVLAVGWLLLAHPLMDTPLPLHAGPMRWFWLSLSGIIGLVIGGFFLFQAFIWIGPRLAMLIMALSPALAVLLAWLITGETLSARQMGGIALTLAGTVWVIRSREVVASQTPSDRKYYLLGILCGLGAATGQTLSLIAARQGSQGGFPTISATLIRTIAAAAAIWMVTILQQQAGPALQSIARQRRAFWYALAGSFFGPFLSGTLSLYAIQHTAIGIASTLSSLTPVILLPVGYLFFHERFGWQAIAGTFLAMSGVAVLFLG